VSQQTGEVNNVPTFNPQQFYTRAGDFQMNKDGYLVNGSGQFLNGWPVDAATGVVNQNSLKPIQVSQTIYNPVATTEVDLSANLPATPANGTAVVGSPISSDIDVYDALGTVHPVSLNWVQNGPGGVPADPNAAPPIVAVGNDWTVTINDATTNAVLGTAEVQFGSASGNSVPAGTVGQIIPGVGVTTPATPAYQAGAAAVMSFSADFGSGTQPITVNLGTYGQTGGLTQYAGTAYSLRGLTQNGVPPGSFAGVTTQANGNVVVNYDNGQTRTIAQVPVVTFNAPNALQSQNGQAFTATLTSGTPLAEQASTNGAGNLVTSSVEGSNVDIASEFSQLIVAQSAYSANTKVVTTANQMLQQTINMQT
jgi:flagellar hook protein FlgE